MINEVELHAKMEEIARGARARAASILCAVDTSDPSQVLLACREVDATVARARQDLVVVLFDAAVDSLVEDVMKVATVGSLHRGSFAGGVVPRREALVPAYLVGESVVPRSPRRSFKKSSKR